MVSGLAAQARRATGEAARPCATDTDTDRLRTADANTDRLRTAGTDQERLLTVSVEEEIPLVDGATGVAVPAVDAVLERVPSEDADVRLLALGTGAVRQRAVYARRGEFADVIDGLARQTRGLAADSGARS